MKTKKTKEAKERIKIKDVQSTYYSGATKEKIWELIDESDEEAEGLSSIVKKSIDCYHSSKKRK
jgi:hypothetical protein